MLLSFAHCTSFLLFAIIASSVSSLIEVMIVEKVINLVLEEKLSSILL